MLKCIALRRSITDVWCVSHRKNKTSLCFTLYSAFKQECHFLRMSFLHTRNKHEEDDGHEQSGSPKVRETEGLPEPPKLAEMQVVWLHNTHTYTHRSQSPQYRTRNSSHGCNTDTYLHTHTNRHTQTHRKTHETVWFQRLCPRHPRRCLAHACTYTKHTHRQREREREKKETERDPPLHLHRNTETPQNT